MLISATRAYATTSHPMRRAGDFVVGKDVVGKDGVGKDSDIAGVASVALTPTEAPLRVTPVSLRMARPDPSFIAHLIATAEQAPQTRELRRAAIADVEAAYRAVANTNVAGSASHRTQRLV